MDFNITFPFTKVDKEKRQVTGIATADNIDSEDDLVDFGGSMEAFSKWQGNIREMHQPIAAGKMVHFTPVKVKGDNGSIYDGVEVTSYVSKGAQDTWEKVLDGTLSGYSIGGGIIDATYEFDKAQGKSYRHVNKYELLELSLVDNPANPLSKFSMIKMAKEGEKIEGFDHVEKINNGLDQMFYKGTDVNNIHTLYYCSQHGIAKADENKCPEHGQMTEIGFIEDFDNEQIRKMIENYENTQNGGENDKNVLPYKSNTDIVKNMDKLDKDTKETVLDKFKKFLDSDDEKQVGDGLFNIHVNVPAPVPLEKSTEKQDGEDDDSQDDGGDDSVNADEIVKSISTLLEDSLTKFETSVDSKIDEVKKEFSEAIEGVNKTLEAHEENITKFGKSGASSKSDDDDGDDSLEKNNSDDLDDNDEKQSVFKGLLVPEVISKTLGYK